MLARSGNLHKRVGPVKPLPGNLLEPETRGAGRGWGGSLHRLGRGPGHHLVIPGQGIGVLLGDAWPVNGPIRAEGSSKGDHGPALGGYLLGGQRVCNLRVGNGDALRKPSPDCIGVFALDFPKRVQMQIVYGVCAKATGDILGQEPHAGLVQGAMKRRAHVVSDCLLAQGQGLGARLDWNAAQGIDLLA